MYEVFGCSLTSSPILVGYYYFCFRSFDLLQLHPAEGWETGVAGVKLPHSHSSQEPPGQAGERGAGGAGGLQAGGSDILIFSLVM